MRLFRSPTKDFCYEWITSHKSLSLRLPLVTCKGGVHISNWKTQILRVLMHTIFQPQINSRPTDILPCFWTFTQSILTADTRTYTRTFCLADPGQIEDAFASRNVHAAEKNTEAWLTYAHSVPVGRESLRARAWRSISGHSRPDICLR